jgi:hypothetical protein
MTALAAAAGLGAALFPDHRRLLLLLAGLFLLVAAYAFGRLIFIRYSGFFSQLAPQIGRPKLVVESLLDQLGASWDEHRPEEMIAAGLMGRAFALLRVTNEGKIPLSSVVARCSFEGDHEIRHGLWSKASGKRFVLGGSHAADIGVGDSRLLVIAQAVSKDDKLWLHLSEWKLHEVPTRASGQVEGVRYLSRTGARLSIAKEVAVSVRFRAKGLDQTEDFRLSFGSDGPVILPQE